MDNRIDYKPVLKEIQAETLKSLETLDRICKKYDIRYFLYWGTLIGAVRHQGFIPWDDDLDIGMMREDYEKLCKVPEDEWDDGTVFVRPESGLMIHDKVFGRLYRKSSRIQSARDVHEWKDSRDGKPFYTSLMCDIYVFDRAVSDPAKYRKVYKKLSRLSAVYKTTKYIRRSGSALDIKTMIKNIYRFILRKTKKEPWKYVAEKYHTLAAAGDSDLYCCYCGGMEAYPESDFFPLSEVKFENMMLPVPKNYDLLLRDYYGDYMKQPPESDRYHIQFIYMDFGDGREYVFDPVPGSLGAGK